MLCKDLGYFNKITNGLGDALKPKSESEKLERARRQEDKRVLLALFGNYFSVFTPLLMLILIGAEQLFTSSNTTESFYAGGILLAWCGDVPVGQTALMLVVLVCVRVLFLKLETCISASLAGKSAKIAPEVGNDEFLSSRQVPHVTRTGDEGI